MARTSAKKDASRQKLVDAAGKAFREHGLGGIGVDGLAKGADLTSGAFYFHFDSKMEVFAEAVKAGLEDLRKGIEGFQAEDGENWVSAFASFYTGTRRTCDLAEGCALPSLTAEVERSGGKARTVYQETLREVAETVERGLAANGVGNSRGRAWALLALLSGGVAVARAVESEALSEEIGAAVRDAALLVAGVEIR